MRRMVDGVCEATAQRGPRPIKGAAVLLPPARFARHLPREAGEVPPQRLGHWAATHNRGSLVPLQPVHGGADHGDVPVPDRLGAVAELRRAARPQFRARLVLHARRLSRLAGVPLAPADARGVLAGGARRGARHRAVGCDRRAVAVPLSLRPRRAVSAAVHLRAGADPRRRREIHLGRAAIVGAGTAGAERRSPALRRDIAALQPLHHGGRAADRGAGLADADAQLGRADGARRRPVAGYWHVRPEREGFRPR